MRPRILIAYANDRVNSLRQLSREAGDIQKALRGAACDVILKPAAVLQDIFDAFDEYQDTIQVFHYAGHANEYALELLDQFGQQQQVSGASFAAYLANTNKNLKLVFLNACSTWAQAQELRDQGIPYVIATSQDVADERAANFARFFYESLAQGYTIPRASSEAASKMGVGAAGSAASWRGIALDEDEAAAASEGEWGLYERPSLPPAAKSWKLDKRLDAPRRERLPDQWHLYCDREPQDSFFKSLYVQPYFQMPKICILTGSLHSSHQSLVSRFEHEITLNKEAERVFGGLKQIERWPSVSAASRREVLPLFAIKAFFGMGGLRSGGRLDKAEAVVSQLRPNSVYLAMQEIDCRDWDESNAADLRWYVEDFWQVAIEDAAQQNKKLFVFLNLILPEKSGFWARFRKSPLEKLLDELEQDARANRAPHLARFPHLGPVEFYDIEKFLSNDPFLRQRRQDAQGFLQRYFAGRKGWEMLEVEKLLQKIAEELNTTRT
jgi:hypothetical protein